MAKKYLRIIYLPSIEGQMKLWHTVMENEAAASDEVYQFGNIIGLNDFAKDSSRAQRGNNMEALVAIASRIDLSRWNQLIGPNEIVALNDPDRWLNQNSRSILRSFWMNPDSKFRVAFAVRGRLITHGGLTYGEWLSLGKPDSAAKTAKLLNEKYRGKLQLSECFNTGHGVNFAADPVFAHPSRELYPSWLAFREALPFDQVTGGGSLNNPEGRALEDGDDSIYRNADKIRYMRYGSKIEINGQRILSLGLELPYDREVTSLSDDRQILVERMELNEKSIQRPF